MLTSSPRMFPSRTSLDVRRNGGSAWRDRLHEVHSSTMEQMETSRRAREALVAQVGLSVKAVLKECNRNFLDLRGSSQRGDQRISEDVAERLERCGQLICAAEDQLGSPIRRRPRGRSSGEALHSNSASMLSCFEQTPPYAILRAVDCRFSMVLLRLCLLAWRSRLLRWCSPPKRPVNRSPSPVQGQWTPPPEYSRRQESGKLVRNVGFTWAAPEDCYANERAFQNLSTTASREIEEFSSPLGCGTVLIAPGDAAGGGGLPFSPPMWGEYLGRQTPSFSGASAIKMMHSTSSEEDESVFI